MKFWLLDTGPIVAFLDSSDKEHNRVVATLDSYSGRLLTTNAVVVESMHFLGRVPTGPAVLVDFLLSARVEIHECSSVEALTAAAELMTKYADIPMDFADATLVVLAMRLKVNAICTLDRRGFRSYRIGRKAFQLVLDEG